MKIAVRLSPLVLALCAACGPAKPAATAQPVSQTLPYRAAVLVAESAWNFAANACDSAGDPDQCVADLIVAHKLLSDLESAVGANWNQSNSCTLNQAIQLVAADVKALGPTPDVVTDAALVAAALLNGSACAPISVTVTAPPDAGAPVMSPEGDGGATL